VSDTGYLPVAPAASSLAVRRIMQGNRSSETRPEIALRSELHRRGRRFRKHHQVMPGLRCRADIVFSKARVVVFVDGCFWHRCPEHLTDPRTNSAYWAAKLDRNIARDRRNDAALEACGWRVVRVWEHELPADAADRVEAVLGERAPALGRTPPQSLESPEHARQPEGGHMAPQGAEFL
jgi:DNA mismatch endonuclease (patch repair protein)